MKTKRSFAGLPILLLILVGSGCVQFKPDPERPAEEARALLPETYSISNAAAVPAQVWWKDFHCEDLDRLMGLALTQNFTVVQAEARMRQAEALAVQAGAVLWPELSGTGDGSFTRQYTGTPATPEAGHTADIESYSLGGLAASYELDLWGRVRSARNAAGRTYQASRQDLESAWMSVSAGIAEQWFQLQSARLQMDLLRRQLETNQKLVELLEMRHRNGQATALDVAQQRQTAAATESAIPPLESSICILSNQLNILAGQPLGSVTVPSAEEFRELPPLPDTGLPADLLTNRPDIRAEGLRLEAAGWDVAEARASRLPAVTLSGSAIYQSDAFADLFDNWLANLAAGFTAPIFDGGRRRAEVRRMEAAWDEQLSVYRETVLQAIADVENALVREDRQAAYLDTLRKELEFARTALKEAQTRYRNGSTDYLNVLAALTSVQGLEQNVISGQQQLFEERIGLYRALGGTWTHAPLDPDWNQTEEHP